MHHNGVNQYKVACNFFKLRLLRQFYTYQLETWYLYVG
jgi:hypothetical protein